MKTSLQIRSLRTAGLALALGLGLAAASHSAQGAILQYTLSGGTITGTLNGSPFTSAVWSITATADTGNVINQNSTYNSISNWVSAPLVTIGTGQTALTATLQNFGAYAYDDTAGGSSPNNSMFYGFDDSSIGGAAYLVSQGGVYNDLKTIATVTGNVAFQPANNYSTNLGILKITGSTSGLGTLNVSAASSTAVPEPGTFIPAAVLVAGALLRRRRSRSHQSGRATA